MFDGNPHPFLDELNVEQRAAAPHSGETLLILAGAGTGKTTTLCARVAWLMAEGVPAERILLLTFTRRAAREIIERARTLAERVAPDAGRLIGGAFHSVAHRFIRVHATSLGLEAGFGVLDAGDAGDLLDLVRQEHGHAESPRRFPRPATMLDIYSRTVNAQTPLSDIDAVIAYGRAHMADFKFPQYVAVREDPLPRNPSGKVLKLRLRDETDWGKPRR
jgi:DNA helicase-2/ATP-dependent DNA helicase PcrA